MRDTREFLFMSGGCACKPNLIAILAIALLVSASALHAEERFGPALTRLLQSAPQSSPLTAWVFFRDKPPSPNEVTRRILSDRSLTRRRKVQGDGAVPHLSDIPVNEEYVATVNRHVIQLRQRSRWFNGISVVVHPDSLNGLLAYSFVRQIELVACYKRETLQPAREMSPAGRSENSFSPVSSVIDYGPSFDQLNQIGVPAVHDSGNFGENVMIGVFDNGFRLLHHEAFDSMNIVATYDFVDKKTSVIPNNPGSSFGGHGINSLSAIGGYKPGQLVGPAFRAAFVLARTENDSSETPLEEDNWVAAIEWADSIGVDVTTTSLVYREYDFPFQGWTWEDMDGNSTMITKAADLAVSKGIIVVNSAGNFGGPVVSGQNTLGAPGDGDSVLTVGAVDGAGARASFSSVGPTNANPPRTKPDVMARGLQVRAASATNPTGYIETFTGTSAACPLVAGAAALVLNRFPDLGPLEIMNALRQTASNASSPNNLMGWGIANAAAAIGFLDRQLNPPPLPDRPALLQNFPNPFNSTTTIRFGLPQPAEVKLEVYNSLGQSIRTLIAGPRSTGWHEAAWDGRDNRGTTVASGVYIYFLSTDSGTGLQMTDSKGVLIR